MLNFAAHKTVPNLAIVPVAPCGQCTGTSHNLPSITIKNGSGGSVLILIDIWGFFDDAQLGNGLDFVPLAAPVRILDTRPGGVGGLTTLTVTTTSQGIAVAPALTANADPGTFTVTASVLGDPLETTKFTMTIL